MKDKVEGTPDGAGRPADAPDVATLVNSLRFERAKNEVLLDEVVALEDEIVNRSLADFDEVVSDETREFWREQLLSNRAAATVALNELAEAKAGGSEQGAVGSGGRRPLHNRATARPRFRQGLVAQGAPDPAAGAAGAGSGDERAAKIRNRAHDISRLERVPFSAAFRRAEKELSGQ